MTDYQIKFLLEYMTNKYDYYSNDLLLIKNRIQIYSLSSDDLLDFILTQCRLDTASAIFRDIRSIIS